MYSFPALQFSKWAVMSSTESEDDIKRRDLRSQPLCLFCYPPTDCPCEEEPYVEKQTQCNIGGPSEKGVRKKWLGAKLKEEMWLRRRTAVSLKRRRRMMEPGKHLKSYFLVSVKPEGEEERVYVPCLIEALETLKDAWPPNKRQSIERYLEEEHKPRKNESSSRNSPMIKGRLQTQVPFVRVSRRSSMPEEFMRKYFLKTGATSEESETNQTFPDPASASSKDLEEKSEKSGDEGGSRPTWQREGGSDGRIKRVTQNDYDKQGKGIIKQKTKEKGLQTGRSTGTSEREDTEDNRTSESLPSSSPVELPRRTSTSGNLSSESEDVKCTCTELTSSKDTSTDLFRSGNSTLSQTVSEKSTSTQDSTISIHSVSTGGSTITADSNSTSPDIFGKTSAKESTSPERSPRVIIIRGRRNFCGLHRRKYPKYLRKRPYCRRRHGRKARRGRSSSKKETTEEPNAEEAKVQREKPVEKYKWAKYTPEEMYMMQQMRHKKFIENQRRFSIPLPATPDTGSISACAASGSAYKHMEELEERILIPRYSALPRTLSMLVNTSSGDTINSDSDSLSLADSLEEFPVVHVHHISHDTKKELKPVRGDVNAPPDPKQKKKKKKNPRSRAFFVSMKDPYGEDELVSGIAKLPEPPERIKERINERQLNILNLRKKNMERRREEMKDKKRQRRHTRERRNLKDRKELPVRKEKEETHKSRHPAKHSDRKVEQESTKTTIMLQATPEGDGESNRMKKTRKEGLTQQEITSGNQKTNRRPDKQQTTDRKKDVIHNVAKPQAVIHPSMPTAESEQSRRNKQAASQSRSWRYRQKFEVIPEEKSSSMSSTDEKTGRRPSLVEPPPPQTNPESGRRYSLGNVSNLVFAKFMEKSLHGMPTTNQPIILVSPKSPHSRKGRDALLAMNRGDFNRLSKGWMNFYMLKENSDESEESPPEERPEKTRGTSRPCGKEKTSEFIVAEKGDDANLKSERDVASEGKIVEQTTPLNEGIRFHSSNTVLKAPKASSDAKISLPELKLTSPSAPPNDRLSTCKDSPLVLPKVPLTPEYDGMDSDSTVYCQPPSLIVPRLAFDGSGDFPSEGSLSETNSDSGETDSKVSKFPVKHYPLRKRGLCQRPRLRKDGHHEPTKRGGQGYPGWSVTVAGTLELSNGTPDLEMRLSFPANGCGPPQASQSDSGFAEEGSQNIETSGRTLEREVITSSGSMKHRWTVTVKNPKQGEAEGIKRRIDKGQTLPNIGQSQSRNVKKVLKNQAPGGECHRKISIYWPKVEVDAGEWADDIINEEELSVRGNAISMEKKPRPPTMSERDLTRGLTARSSLSDAKFSRK